MSDFMFYKGYTGSVEYSAEDDVMFGEVLGIRSLLLYEGNNLDELRQCFEEFVDEYLDECAEEGIAPERPSEKEIPQWITISATRSRK